MNLNRRLIAMVPRRTACMGGWCQHRNHCALHLAADRRVVSERMCPKDAPQPVPVVAEYQREAA
jgi:hypothetical protein